MFITGHRDPPHSPVPLTPRLFPRPPIPVRPHRRLRLPKDPVYTPSADELFLMTHGYPRDNPPKHIPNRRLDEDTRGFSLFREIKTFF